MTRETSPQPAAAANPDNRWSRKALHILNVRARGRKGVEARGHGPNSVDSPDIRLRATNVETRRRVRNTIHILNVRACVAALLACATPAAVQPHVSVPAGRIALTHGQY